MGTASNVVPTVAVEAAGLGSGNTGLKQAIAEKVTPTKLPENDAPESVGVTEKLPESLPNLPENHYVPEVETTGKEFFEDDDEFTDEDYYAADGMDSATWRIEKKRYTRKTDNVLMEYYNYRKRKGEVHPTTGKRKNVYWPGGKKVL